MGMRRVVFRGVAVRAVLVGGVRRIIWSVWRRVVRVGLVLEVVLGAVVGGLEVVVLGGLVVEGEAALAVEEEGALVVVGDLVVEGGSAVEGELGLGVGVALGVLIGGCLVWGVGLGAVGIGVGRGQVLGFQEGLEAGAGEGGLEGRDGRRLAWRLERQSIDWKHSDQDLHQGTEDLTPT